MFSRTLLATLIGAGLTVSADDFARERSAVAALGGLTDPPAVHPAAGFEPDGAVRPLFFDALPFKGGPTRVFAWLGVPESTGKVPGVVLVHGGGGTAFKEWVKRWNDRGYAAISIAVEGQTDVKGGKGDTDVIPTQWKRHAWAGPHRQGIYHDTGEPLEDQWMYHAAGAVILANSLLRSQPGVDADRVGLMGVSWGGVITATAMGIDDRFAFAIPVYGCGHLADADNQYGKSLGGNDLYRRVWDPVLRLSNAAMPSLWFSWPGDQHFPLDCQAATIRAVSGPHMLSLVPGMGHGHGPAWIRPESYAFADSVVRSGTPWSMERSVKMDGLNVRVSMQSSKPFDRAVLIATADRGITGKRAWTETPARLDQVGGVWVASAGLPAGSTAWFMNFISGDLVSSSGYTEREPGVNETPVETGGAEASAAGPEDARLTGLFRSMDTDGSGTVTAIEFTDKWTVVFRAQDRDGDGLLGPDEFSAKNVFGQFDADGSGGVSEEEDRDMRLRHFQSLDRDEDGMLTLDEMLRK